MRTTIPNPNNPHLGGANSSAPTTEVKSTSRFTDAVVHICTSRYFKPGLLAAAGAFYSLSAIKVASLFLRDEFTPTFGIAMLAAGLAVLAGSSFVYLGRISANNISHCLYVQRTNQLTRPQETSDGTVLLQVARRILLTGLIVLMSAAVGAIIGSVVFHPEILKVQGLEGLWNPAVVAAFAGFLGVTGMVEGLYRWKLGIDNSYQKALEKAAKGTTLLNDSAPLWPPLTEELDEADRAASMFQLFKEPSELGEFAFLESVDETLDTVGRTLKPGAVYEGRIQEESSARLDDTLQSGVDGTLFLSAWVAKGHFVNLRRLKVQKAACEAAHQFFKAIIEREFHQQFRCDPSAAKRTVEGIIREINKEIQQYQEIGDWKDIPKINQHCIEESSFPSSNDPENESAKLGEAARDAYTGMLKSYQDSFGVFEKLTNHQYDPFGNAIREVEKSKDSKIEDANRQLDGHIQKQNHEIEEISKQFIDQFNNSLLESFRVDDPIEKKIGCLLRNTVRLREIRKQFKFGPGRDIYNHYSAKTTSVQQDTNLFMEALTQKIDQIDTAIAPTLALDLPLLSKQLNVLVDSDDESSDIQGPGDLGYDLKEEISKFKENFYNKLGLGSKEEAVGLNSHLP